MEQIRLTFKLLIMNNIYQHLEIYKYTRELKNITNNFLAGYLTNIVAKL